MDVKTISKLPFEDVIQRLVPVNPTPGAWHTYEADVRGGPRTAKLDSAKSSG